MLHAARACGNLVVKLATRSTQILQISILTRRCCQHICRSTTFFVKGEIPLMPLSEAEQHMWVKAPRTVRTQMSDDEIDAKYSSREERIVTETNREKLPNFVEALKKPGYMNLRPFYQRRRRWS